VLISDIEMPEQDGYVLVRKLRSLEDDQGRRIPAVALTAHARTEDRMQALAAGFDTHVPKPVEPAELVTVVASLARRRFKARGM
jgi:CheY-like chemotaxis protein